MNPIHSEFVQDTASVQLNKNKEALFSTYTLAKHI